MEARRQERGVLVGPENLRQEEMIIDAVMDDPNESVRPLSKRLNIHKFKVHQIIKRNDLYPYHYTKVQKVDDDDYLKRRRFCRWINKNPENVRNVLWTDECLFTREGSFNTKNHHYYANENPYVFKEKSFQRRFKLNIWAGMIDDRVIGPFLLSEILNVSIYFK